MFNWGKKKKLGISPQAGCVYAAVRGNILPIEKMPDPVFADKIVGDGICILPDNGLVYSPVSGKLVSVADACHAYGILADDGAELLVHIGVDTVELKGNGFLPKVKQGGYVQAGELLCEVDMGALERAGMQSHTAVLITNMSSYLIEDIKLGAAEAGGMAFKYRKGT